MAVAADLTVGTPDVEGHGAWKERSSRALWSIGVSACDGEPVGDWLGCLPRSRKYVTTCPLPFISMSPLRRTATEDGSDARVSSPNCTSPGRPFCIIRAAVFMVSPNKRKRGNFCPITPATTGPVWMPIWKTTCIWRFRMCAWTSAPLCSTPTAHTYSSQIVSILVIFLLSQTSSKRVKTLLSSSSTSAGPGSARAIWSKSTMVMNRMEARPTSSAMRPSGSFSIRFTTWFGTMSLSTRTMSSAVSFSLCARTKSFRWPLSM